MNSVIEAKVMDYCRYELQRPPVDCVTILDKIRELARVVGYDVDARFASVGLGAGPEARVASAIVNYASGGGGCATPEDQVRREVDQWLHRTARRVG